MCLFVEIFDLCEFYTDHLLWLEYTLKNLTTFWKIWQLFEKLGNFFEKICKKTLKNSFEVDYQTQKRPRFNPGTNERLGTPIFINM